jgi:cell filamentation protein
VTFDPFGDFETRGYLRNVARTKDSKIVRQMEHASFTTSLDAAFAKLASQKTLSYDDVLGTHKILFEAVYPWAGRDRLATAPRLVVSKANDSGKISFAYPQDIRRAIDYGLDHGQDKKFMAAKPGEIMGIWRMAIRFLTAMAGPSWCSIACSRNARALALIGQQRARTIIWPLSPRNLKTPIKDI